MSEIDIEKGRRLRDACRVYSGAPAGNGSMQALTAWQNWVIANMDALFDELAALRHLKAAINTAGKGDAAKTIESAVRDYAEFYDWSDSKWSGQDERFRLMDEAYGRWRTAVAALIVRAERAEAVVKAARSVGVFKMFKHPVWDRLDEALDALDAANGEQEGGDA